MIDKDRAATDAVVFISYASENHAEAEMIRGDLEADGFRCWMASRDILGSTDYLTVIPQTIESTKVFLLVLSAQAMASDHVYREVHTAADAKLPMLPVRIDSAAIEGRLKFAIASAQWIDAYPRVAPALGRIRHDLHEILQHRGIVIRSRRPPRILRVLAFAVAWVVIAGLTVLVAVAIHGYWFNLVAPSKFVQTLARHPVPLLLVLLPLLVAMMGQYVAHASLRDVMKMDALFAVGQGVGPLVRTIAATLIAAALFALIRLTPPTVTIAREPAPTQENPADLFLASNCDARRFVETTRAYAVRVRVGAYNASEPVRVGVEYDDPDSVEICRIWVGSGFDAGAEKRALPVQRDDKLRPHRTEFIELRNSGNGSASHLVLVTLIHPRTATLGQPAQLVVALEHYPSVTGTFTVSEEHWR